MSEISCYTMDLYCDTFGEYAIGGLDGDTIHEYKEFPQQFIGVIRSDCWREARKAGWTFKRDGRRFCPKCKHRGKT